jgi:hypothetical protein
MGMYAKGSALRATPDKTALPAAHRTQCTAAGRFEPVHSFIRHAGQEATKNASESRSDRSDIEVPWWSSSLSN